MLPERRRREVAQRVRERDVATGDRGGACAAISLDDVAVDDHAARTQRLEIDRRAQRTSHEPLDLEGPPAGTALEALAAAALGRRAREHRVLGGDPALLLAEQVARHALLDRREAEHLGVTEADLARALRELGHAHGELDPSQRVVHALARTLVCRAHAVSSHIRRIWSGAYDSSARPSRRARSSTFDPRFTKRPFA